MTEPHWHCYACGGVLAPTPALPDDDGTEAVGACLTCNLLFVRSRGRSMLPMGLTMPKKHEGEWQGFKWIKK